MDLGKMQTKEMWENFHEEIERHVNYLHSSSIYPQERVDKTEKGRKSKIKIIATIAS